MDGADPLGEPVRLGGPGGQAAILAGVVLLAAILLALAPDPNSLSETETAAPTGGPAGASTSRPGTNASGNEKSDAGVRDVTPDDVTHRGGAGAGDEAMVRLPPREPLSKPKELKPAPPKDQLLARPIAIDAGRIAYRQGVITLPGVESLPLKAECGTGAAAWPCGVRSRTELRRFLHGRSIRCEVPADFGERRGTATSACTVGSDDVGGWVVANGWAKAAPGGPYAQAEEEAKRARLGIWR
ncbi:thermonuclease family protein [Aurantimonas sp. VKM B-3413]|uniref:thermonuclease family protein n=1 Tax=Aurantimonas sp. VKM B-3413 TaxID=2779401 RepID=UPI001E5F3600|nr:thermonuclease family protein [Aurantimonas sp. VKM B-3413]MCB8835994.1 thermonuclease family protein [Aurantimonas sp. VKM B-3413]